MSVDSAAKPPRTEPNSVGFNLSAIALALLLGGLALAYAIDAASRDVRRPAHRADSETMLTRTIGGKQLTIPLSWFRYAEQSADGFAKQVDLHFALPLGPDGAVRDVEVTLLPRSTVRPSAKLLDGVYLHMFEPTQLEGPVGLVGKPLQGKEGYRGEVVWYDPISADPFVAKCSPSVAAGAAASCLRTVHLAPGIAAIYSFGADLLANWKEFDPQMRERLARIGVF
jgi:hypothetical protein